LNHMAVYGGTILNLSLGFAALTIAALYFYNRTKDTRLFLVSQRLSLVVSFGVMLCTVVLLGNLLQSNFDVDYVAKYTSLGTPTIYKFTALWAGQSGSLLFWLFILSVYSAVVVIQNRKNTSPLIPYVIGTLAVIQLFFLILVNYVANPFHPVDVDFAIQDGLGLNPLLQNATMAIHPPMLYLGYVGFAVPFAFAVGALISRQLDSLWVRSIRRWTLFTWLALGCGIILGGWWAYQELGWGGYWAWDPVENASLMPWLTGTAFVHSIIIQEKKNMLKVWNMVLILVTFLLSIFGTFLTRSGIVSSVHSFTESAIGPFFLGFVLLILGASIYLLLTRLNELKSEKRMESFVSRESGFLFNNVIFVSLCFAVLWGTLFPVISEAIRGTKITVGAPFFNQLAVPIGILLLLLTGVGPLLAWKRTSRKSLVRNFSVPISGGLGVSGIAALSGGGSFYVVTTFGIIGFVTSAIGLEFYRGIRVRVKKFGETFFTALVRMVSKNRSRYGGYIVHIGIVLMFIGFVGKAFSSDKEWTISTGETVELKGYRFHLANVTEAERSNHYAWIAHLDVEKNNEELLKLMPEKRVYFHTDPNPERRQPHSEADIHTTWLKDIYAVFGGIDLENELVSLKIMINPLVRFVWLGGLVLLFGTVVALWPSKEKI